MNKKLDNFRLKHILGKYFATHKKMRVGKMYFRLYEPDTEEIVSNYSKEDWSLIFCNTTENDMKELSYCKNVSILMWCEVETNISHGMVFLEESISVPNQVSFHGGTWEHNPGYFLEIFRSLTYLFDIILDNGIEITTTCNIANKRAAKLQKSMGFVETGRYESIIYKKLNIESYRTSTVVNKMRIQNFNI